MFFKKIQVQIILFKIRAVVKLSRISNPKSPPKHCWISLWVFLGKRLKNSVLSFFQFWLWINGKTIKTPGSYENAYLHIWSICVKQYVSSLIQIQYLQIESSDKGTLTNENMILKMFYQSALMGCRISSFISFLSLQLNEFLQSEINQKLSSVQEITCNAAIADKKIISVIRRRI